MHAYRTILLVNHGFFAYIGFLYQSRSTYSKIIADGIIFLSRYLAQDSDPIAILEVLFKKHMLKIRLNRYVFIILHNFTLLYNYISQ
jgi:hypothetical protein